MSLCALSTYLLVCDIYLCFPVLLAASLRAEHIKASSRSVCVALRTVYLCKSFQKGQRNLFLSLCSLCARSRGSSDSSTTLSGCPLCGRGPHLSQYRPARDLFLTSIRSLCALSLCAKSRRTSDQLFQAIYLCRSARNLSTVYTRGNRIYSFALCKKKAIFRSSLLCCVNLSVSLCVLSLCARSWQSYPSQCFHGKLRFSSPPLGNKEICGERKQITKKKPASNTRTHKGPGGSLARIDQRVLDKFK